MKAILVQSNSGRFYLELDSKIIESAYLSTSNCQEIFASQESNKVEVDIISEFDFNGIGYSEIPKLDENGCYILKI
jgi:hypothetical protein